MKFLRFEHHSHLTAGNVSEIVVIFLKEWNTCDLIRLQRGPFTPFFPFNDHFEISIGSSSLVHF